MNELIKPRIIHLKVPEFRNNAKAKLTLYKLFHMVLSERRTGMTPGGKDTRTGAIWEQVIKPVLEENYPGKYKTQVNVGKQLFGSFIPGLLNFSFYIVIGTPGCF